jgi:hypothetical protein
VLAAAGSDDDVLLYLNDGAGSFARQTIDGDADGANSVYAADVDGDGDLDVLAAAGSDDDVLLYLNDGAGSFAKQTLDADAGVAYSVTAADMDGDGDLDVLAATFFANDVRLYEQTMPTVVLTGDAGWRMLSAPVTGFTLDQITDDIAVQGVPGGANPDSPSNVFYRPSTGEWTVPAGVSAPLPTGLGYIAYVYDNDLAGSTPLPDTLDIDDASLREPSADVVVAVDQGGFTLMGNPFAQGLAIDRLAGNGAFGVQGGLLSPIQVWDDGTGTPEGNADIGTTGSFVSYNLGEGQIVAPWQGFMLEANNEDALGATSVTIPLAARTSAAPTVAVFFKNSDEPLFRRLSLVLDGPPGSGAQDRSAGLYFHPTASDGRDGYDGTKLVPLLAEYVSLGFMAPDGSDELLVQDSRALTPAEVQRYELNVRAQGLDGELTLRWPERVNLPADWRIELLDRATGTTVDLAADTSYSFVLGREQIAGAVDPLAAGRTLRAQQASETVGRFRIAVVPAGVVVATDDLFDVPQEARLEGAAPNPFRGQTTIRFALPSAQRVRLTIYDALGRQVALLADQTFTAGENRVVWGGSSLPSGLYFVRLETDSRMLTRSITLLR